MVNAMNFLHCFLSQTTGLPGQLKFAEGTLTPPLGACRSIIIRRIYQISTSSLVYLNISILTVTLVACRRE